MFSQRNATSRLGMLIVLVAGLWTIAHLILTVAGVTANDYLDVALLILFLLALIVVFMQFSQERSALTAVSSTERFPEPAISKFFLGSEGSSQMWFVVRMYVGSEWLLAGWEKVTSPVWGASGKALAGFAAGALAKSSGANPAVQGWYAWFLQHMVLPHAGLFSFLCRLEMPAAVDGELANFTYVNGVACCWGFLFWSSWVD